MRIVPLSEWYPDMYDRWVREGRRYKAPERTSYTVHHTAGGTGDDPLDYARWVADWHFDKWSRPGGYNFLIGDDSTIFEMCGWEFVGAHAPGGNRRSIGVSFQGSFRSTLPNAGQLAAFAWLVDTHTVPGRQWGHRDWSDTTCPGTRLYRAIPLDVEDDVSIAEWAKASVNKALGRGIFTKDTDFKSAVTPETLAVYLNRAGLLDHDNAETLEGAAAMLSNLEAVDSSPSALRYLVEHLRDHPEPSGGLSRDEVVDLLSAELDRLRVVRDG